MLSLKRGIEIAVITEGKMKNKKLFLYGKDDFTQKQPSEVIVDVKERKKLVPQSFFKDKKIKQRNEKALKRYIDDDATINTVPEDLQEEYIEAFLENDPEGYEKSRNQEKGDSFGNIFNPKPNPLSQ